MRISIITVVYNNKKYIEDCIRSVLGQTYKNIEYVVIDGGSTDGTVDVINKHKDSISKLLIEMDDGIYDAMNKGIKLASGDIIGILNSDDFYINDEIISNVAEEFEIKNVDSVFADLVFVKRDNTSKITRYYDSSYFNPDKFAYGWMPAHTTFFLKRIYYEKYGLFKTNYQIASDYELLARMLVKHNLSYSYIPKPIIKMREGGLSTRNFISNFILNKEILRACAENNIETNIYKIYSKYFTKVFQLIRRNENFSQRS